MKKPISPHLTIYKIQNSSLVSITHRFSAIFLFLYLFVFCGAFFLSTQVYYYYCIFVHFILFLIFNFLAKLSLLFSIFHLINGLRLTLVKFDFINHKLF